jgi:hypothetical protein
MKLSIIKQLLVLSGFLLLIFSSCDILEAPYKKDHIILSTERKVLLEDYTGHQCVNCPGAAQIIHDIKESYEENLIVIGVHAGSLAKLLSPPCTYNFTTSTGDIWCDYFGIENQGYPNGLINRKERNGSLIISPNNWATAIEEQLALPAEAEITLSSNYNSTSKEIEVAFSTNISSPVQGEKYYLTIVVTEDSIIKPQKNNNPNLGATPVILDYVHMHVLRLSITGEWGLKINPDIIDSRTLKITIPDGSDIIPEHCNVVAFISDSSRQVLQAEEVKVIQ